MGLISETVLINWNYRNRKWFEEKGYKFTKYGDKFVAKVKDLNNGSNTLVEVKCDGENCLNPYLKPVKWVIYLKYVKDDGKYYCNSCAKKLYGGENVRKTKLKNGKSFEQWCVENNRQDVLERWDYELNNYNPNEVSYASTKKIYFKCPRGIHKSEPKTISVFTNGQDGYIKCSQCNSFAQWGIDNICYDFLEKYWDYEKNIIDPWKISFSSNKKVYIKCQNKDYHGSYKIQPNNFIKGNRCPYCNNRNGKIHILDSLGYLYPEALKVWSDKNKKSAYEYAPFSKFIVQWKCNKGIHEDYKRSISNSTVYNFRCPQCQYSKGEERIGQYLIQNNIKHITQKTFNDLRGIKGGLLSYDFYLPEYNLLIEYQGEFHDINLKNDYNYTEYLRKNLQKQYEHDKRKREYAKNNNIKLLEIWYWDFDNIESILQKELNLQEVMSIA